MRFRSRVPAMCVEPWSTPRKVGAELRVFPFVLRWGDVSQRGVSALTVVEHLDVLDDGCAGFGPGGKVGVVDQLLLQRSKETLHRGIIPAVGLVAHAAGDT